MIHCRGLCIEPLEDRRLLSAGPWPAPLRAVEPLGSLVYESSVQDRIALPGETDRFTIDLDAPRIVASTVLQGAAVSLPADDLSTDHPVDSPYSVNR